MYSLDKVFNQLTTVFTSLLLALGLLTITGVVSAQYTYDQFDNDVKQCMSKRSHCSKKCSSDQCINKCTNQEKSCIGQLEKKLSK